MSKLFAAIERQLGAAALMLALADSPAAASTFTIGDSDLRCSSN
jgi:hypothetical protein